MDALTFKKGGSEDKVIGRAFIDVEVLVRLEKPAGTASRPEDSILHPKLFLVLIVPP